jgi:hypothetical protein
LVRSSCSDAANIPTHPRDLPALARRPDTSRKEAREARRIRKAEEKLQKEEERKKLKNEKRKELDKKLAQLGVGKDGKGQSDHRSLYGSIIVRPRVGMRLIGIV